MQAHETQCMWIGTYLGMPNLSVQVTISVEGSLMCSYVVS